MQLMMRLTLIDPALPAHPEQDVAASQEPAVVVANVAECQGDAAVSDCIPACCMCQTQGQPPPPHLRHAMQAAPDSSAPMDTSNPSFPGV